MGMIWDNTKLKMNVNMNGKEYMEYKKRKKVNLTKNQKLGFVYLGLSLIGVLIITALIIDLTPKPKVEPAFRDWYDAMPTMATFSWDNIAKLTFLYFAPFLVIVIGLAWLFHGFGFIIIRR